MSRCAPDVPAPFPCAISAKRSGCLQVTQKWPLVRFVYLRTPLRPEAETKNPGLANRRQDSLFRSHPPPCRVGVEDEEKMLVNRDLCLCTVESVSLAPAR